MILKLIRNVIKKAKKPVLFVTYIDGEIGMENYFPVLPLFKGMRESLKTPEGTLDIMAVGDPRKGIGITLNGDTRHLHLGEKILIDGALGSFHCRLIYDWTGTSNHRFPGFFGLSILIHILMILAFAVPTLFAEDQVKKEDDKETVDRVQAMLEKMDVKVELKPKKPEPPKPEEKQIVVQKKEKKKGFFPTSKKVQKKQAKRKTRRRRSRGRSSGKRSAKAAPAGINSINNIFSGSSKTIASASTKSSGRRSRSKAYGVGGIPIGPGINSGNNTLSKKGNYGSGPIVTKGVRGTKKGNYSGATYTGGSKTLSNTMGRVSAGTLRGSNKGGKVGGSIRSSGGLRTTGKGKISKSAIKKAIRKKLHRLTYCYEKALLRKPHLSGRIKIRWTIKTNRRVAGTKIIKSQMKDSKLHRCLMKEIKKIRFPAPKGGAATVEYPFKFSPSN